MSSVQEHIRKSGPRLFVDRELTAVFNQGAQHQFRRLRRCGLGSLRQHIEPGIVEPRRPANNPVVVVQSPSSPDEIGHRLLVEFIRCSRRIVSAAREGIGASWTDADIASVKGGSCRRRLCQRESGNSSDQARA